jgi:hypothetical protein
VPQLKDLIEQAGKGAKDQVESAKTRYLDQVRAVLRDLTRLKFSDRQGSDPQHTSVPIRVMPGLPDPLNVIAEVELPSGERWGVETIGLWKHDFGVLQTTCARLLPLAAILAENDVWRERGDRYETGLTAAQGIATELAEYAARAELLKQITSLNQDVLGVYRSAARLFPDRGHIELFWVVIGAVARLVGVDTEALTVVVMTHELAHAYTHLGLDSNKNRWEEGFWGCDDGIIEGLAQYYTHKTVEVLRKERGYENVWTAYDDLTKLQKRNGAVVYVNHLEWVKRISPEAMRQGLLDLRRNLIARDFVTFEAALEELSGRYPLSKS